jgi:1-acyl-sn-glycerol-3-phosphate acyltransferase
MAVRKRNPRVRLKKWPTDDWYYTNGLYRFIKATFQRPIAGGLKLQIRGAEHVPREGPVLLACNHFSWADPVLLGAAIQRPAFYLAKERLFVNPVARWFLEGLGQIKVDRVQGGNEPSLAHAIECLQQGLVIGVFPEGTRSRYGELKRGKTGIARIAARSGAAVVPVAMTTAEFWPKNAALPNVREPVFINIGAPMRLDLKPEDAEDRQRMRDATDDVMERIRALLAEAAEAKRRGEKWT